MIFRDGKEVSIMEQLIIDNEEEKRDMDFIYETVKGFISKIDKSFDISMFKNVLIYEEKNIVLSFIHLSENKRDTLYRLLKLCFLENPNDLDLQLKLKDKEEENIVFSLNMNNNLILNIHYTENNFKNIFNKDKAYVREFKNYKLGLTCIHIDNEFRKEFLEDIVKTQY